MNCLSPRSSSVKDAQARANIRDRREKKSASSPSSPKMKAPKIDRGEENTAPLGKVKKQEGKSDSPRKFIVRKLRHLSGRKKKNKAGDQTEGQAAGWVEQLEKWEDQSKDLDELGQSEVQHEEESRRALGICTAQADDENEQRVGSQGKECNQRGDDLWISTPEEVETSKSSSVTSRVISKKVIELGGRDVHGDVQSPDVLSYQSREQYGANQSLGTFVKFQTSTPVEMPSYSYRNNCNFEDELSPKPSFETEIDSQSKSSLQSVPAVVLSEADDVSVNVLPKEVGPFRSPTVISRVISKTVFTTDATDTLSTQSTQNYNITTTANTTHPSAAPYTAFQTSTPLEMPSHEFKRSCNFEDELSSERSVDRSEFNPSSKPRDSDPIPSTSNVNPSGHSVPVGSFLHVDIEPQVLHFIPDEDRINPEDEEETQAYGLSDCGSDLWSDEDEDDDVDDEEDEEAERIKLHLSRVWKCPDEDDLDPDPATPSHVATLHDMSLPATPPPLNLDTTSHWSRPLSAIPEVRPTFSP